MFDRIPDFTSKLAELHGERLAFRDLTSGETLTHAAFDGRVALAAGMLSAQGVGEGDRVAILCRNRIEFFELLFACGRLGAILVPLNWRMPAAELGPLIEDCSPALLLAGREDSETAAALCTGGMPLAGLDERDGYPSLRDAARPARGDPLWPAGRTWYLLYTSGTTGKPKAVIQTPAMAIANYVNIRQAMAIGRDDVCLNYLPLFHTAGINLVTLPTLFEGGAALVLPGFDVEQIVGLLADGRLDTFFGVPACYREIALHEAFDTLDLGAVRAFGCGGAPLPEHLVETYLGRGARIMNGMGMTETGPTVFLMDGENVASRIGSVGKPQLLSRVRLVDDDGRDVGDGEEGELLFGGPGVTPGYWRRPDATAESFSDGWLKSGDVGRRDEDGYYYIAGRIKDMFISGGENVYPAEIENLLAAHPDILEAAVVAEADPKWGEVGLAYLQAKPGHGLPDAESLRSYCRKNLAAYKVPKRFVAVEDFPRTAAGKIRKHLLSGNGRS